MSLDEPFALLAAALAISHGWLQFRQAREPLVDSHYPFVKTKSRTLRLVAALWAWLIAVVALAIAF